MTGSAVVNADINGSASSESSKQRLEAKYFSQHLSADALQCSK
ncbi:hypothetical protein PC116_g18113 [Phytophthora cactorum]|uniref:Uncharacterized protein n=1 Tax=Phytophthora cactorum TaxID=29920 RepID=A0A8T1K9B0_9STRA|nr:hypothetical protein Pcac1_g5132 [Phytophthora cactorum]KAG2903061.1 hypothetical protein PC114_g12443 [Phytophthora cactorum]KAG2919015.1 hypothetical protein PC117_g16877 [Phytophthora cactorum]KAG3028309.1 hypothetical protein PC119_g7087 [Phytophthora cactorum]KAG3153226.1 hypothetical protein C6341_g16015 [Phytophthora cactorum]